MTAVSESSEKRPWAASQIEMRPISELRGYDRNSRTHSDLQIAQVAASMAEWGWTVPILIDEQGMIIAGHARLRAAVLNQITAVPCVVARGWTEEQKRAYVIADNKLTENGGWDSELLASELQALGQAGFDLELTGFSDLELGAILAEKTAGLTDPDEVPEIADQAVSRLGDIWQMGNHRLICGDSTDAAVVGALLGPVRPHLMVTDPPYGVEYDANWRAEAGVNRNKAKMGAVKNDGRSDWHEAWDLFSGDVAYIWHADRFASTVQQSLEQSGFQVRCQIIWAKDRFALSRGHYHWQHEPCWYAVKEKGTGHWSGDRSQTTLWNIKSREDKGHGHSTQKPVECMKRPIENNSSPGQAVYEPFSGSGTTIIAGEMTGRHIYAIELNPLYVDMAIKRWQEFTGKEATLEGTGETFKSRAEAPHGKAP